LEAHYKIYFQEKQTNSFSISRVGVDLVYGQTPASGCSTPINPKQVKTSLTYLQDQSQSQPSTPTSHLVSGSPGYKKGSPILIAKRQVVSVPLDNGSTSQVNLFNHNLNGFSLKGADQNG
jgi:hypothetical protein